MRNYGLFVIAFLIVSAALIKSQKSAVKKVLAKKNTVSLTQWPSEMKKSLPAKLSLENLKNKVKTFPSSAAQTAKSEPSPVQNQARGIASVSPSQNFVPVAGRAVGSNFPVRHKVRGYAAGNYYPNAASYGGPLAANRPALNSGGRDTQLQELSSFTRTPDLSINAGLDPELSLSFEDQIRKFREQNQLTAQDLQELEVITGNFQSMAYSVQRGQLSMPQVNAEAIKITRSFINLKRKVESRPQ